MTMVAGAQPSTSAPASLDLKAALLRMVTRRRVRPASQGRAAAHAAPARRPRSRCPWRRCVRRSCARWPNTCCRPRSFASSWRCARPTSRSTCRASAVSASTSISRRAPSRLRCARSRTRPTRCASSTCRRCWSRSRSSRAASCSSLASPGSGKSTALAAMVQHINERRAANIITIEDPIEFVHRDVQESHQPARSRHGHRDVRAGAAPRAASGSGRDHDR